VSSALFVSNGHGEIAIAARIARETGKIAPVRCDHLALVSSSPEMPLRDVGPRRKMPSGGMLAMGNVANFARDIAAGLGSLTVAQWRFLVGEGKSYDAVVAIGDAFALFMALRARRPAVYVGTARSVFVAPPGRFEESLMRRAASVFVRDEATVRRLARDGVHAAAANVMADLSVPERDERPGLHGDPRVAIFPGSRESAYENAAFLIGVLREARVSLPGLRAVLSVAPALQARRLADAFAGSELRVVMRDDPLEPFSLFESDVEIARAWTGEIGAAVEHAAVVLGQAGTANEAAAAAGVPVVAFEGGGGWYRRRQAALLDGALRVFPRDARTGARELVALLRNPGEREAMSRIGRERLGAPGAAHRIAETIVRLCA
jgi:uncharacterized protein (TIGR03492 family)